MDRDTRPEQAGRPEPATAPGEAPPVDVHELADRVYRLMRDEVRLARARGGRAAGQGKD